MCHADTSGKWAIVQDGHYGAVQKTHGGPAEEEEEGEEEERRSPFRGPLQRNIKGQSWLTQFSATSVEPRFKTTERGEGGGITMSPGINKRA